MAIGDPLIIKRHKKHGFFYVTCGRETFYDKVTCEWITFETHHEAWQWCVDVKGEEPLLSEDLITNYKPPAPKNQMKFDL